MSGAVTTSLDGRRKAAVLVLSLGTEAAAKALRGVSEERLLDLARAIAELERAPIAPEVVESVLKEFKGSLKGAAGGMRGGTAVASGLLDAAVGPEKRARVLAQLEVEKRAESPFAEFAQLDPRGLSRALDGELPQVQALVLAHVPPELSSATLLLRPAEERTELLVRMARMEEVSPDLAVEVGAALGVPAPKKNYAARPAATGGGRVRAVAEVVNLLAEKPEGKDELERLRARDQEIAAQVEKQSLVFDDLIRLDDRGIQRVLGRVDGKLLALALKATDAAVAEKILGNLSKRARESLLEEKELLGPQPLSTVEDAQRDVLNVVRELVQQGEIKLSRGGKEGALVE